MCRLFWHNYAHLRQAPGTGASTWWAKHTDHHMPLLLSPDGPSPRFKDSCEPGDTHRCGAIPTAAHCPNSEVGLSSQAEYDGPGIDAQWYKTLESTTNTIRYNSAGVRRSIIASTTAAAGAQVCGYGMATGYKCATVLPNDACWPLGYCNCTALTAAVTSGGGSGGPWFVSSRAAGIHKGTAFISGASRSVYTQAWRALNYFGLTLCVETGCGWA